MTNERRPNDAEETKETVHYCEDCGYPSYGEEPPLYCTKCESEAPEGDACWTGA